MTHHIVAQLQKNIGEETARRSTIWGQLTMSRTAAVGTFPTAAYKENPMEVLAQHADDIQQQFQSDNVRLVWMEEYTNFNTYPYQTSVYVKVYMTFTIPKEKRLSTRLMRFFARKLLKHQDTHTAKAH